MTPDKFWMIVDISHTEERPCGCATRTFAVHPPKCLHFDREIAERELLRLSEKYSHGTFILLEAVAEAKPRTIYSVQPIQEIPF